MENYSPNQTPIINNFQITTPIPNPNTIPNCSHNTTPNTIQNDAPTVPNNDLILIQEDNASVELKSTKKEVDEADDKPLTSKKNPNRNSNCWDHYTKVKGRDYKEPKFACPHCGALYSRYGRRVDTINLHDADWKKVK